MKIAGMFLLCLLLLPALAMKANAVEFDSKGLWIMSFDAGDGGNFSQYADRAHQRRSSGYKGLEDNFEVRQRLRLQLDAVASPELSGTLQFEIGDSIWGKADQGAALGGDSPNIKVKQAYLTWTIPQSSLTVRMGRQSFALPAFTTGASDVLDDNATGIVLTNKFNDSMGLTALWARFYNDNYSGGGSAAANSGDNVDAFGLLLPMRFEGLRLTPWALYTHFGPNFIRKNDDALGQAFGFLTDTSRRAILPNYFTYNSQRWTAGQGREFEHAILSRPSQGIWLGLTGEITALEAWRFAWDANYGSIKHEFDWLDRKGWYVSALGEYTQNWGMPGLYAWYSSGDDADPSNGSERLPSLSAESDNAFSSAAFSGNSFIGREKLFGHSMHGTWGLGARVKNIRFVDDLKHLVRVNYMGGTNAPAMAKYMTGAKVKAEPYAQGWGNTDFNSDDKSYLTTNDHALELGLATEYALYEYFTIYMDATYIKMWLDADTWKGSTDMRHVSVTDAWNVNLAFIYAF